MVVRCQQSSANRWRIYHHFNNYIIPIHLNPLSMPHNTTYIISADQPQDAGHLPLHLPLHSPPVGLEALLPFALPPARPSRPVYALLEDTPLPLQVYLHLQPQRLLIAPGRVPFPEHALPELLIPDLVYFF